MGVDEYQGIPFGRLPIRTAIALAPDNPAIAESVLDCLMGGVLVSCGDWWGCHWFMVRGEAPTWLRKDPPTEKEELQRFLDVIDHQGKPVKFGDPRPPLSGKYAYRPLPLPGYIGISDDFKEAVESFHPGGKWGVVETGLTPMTHLFVYKNAEGERVGFVPPIQDNRNKDA